MSHISKQFGDWGEKVAKKYLEERGYKILAEKYRCKCGEIDLVAEHQGRFVFIEVKSRQSVGFGQPEDAIHTQKQRKLILSARWYLMKHNLDENFQIDSIAVEFLPGETKARIRHLENAVEDYK